MIMREDIDPTWSSDDVALFAATVGAVQQAVKETAMKYGRASDPIIGIVGQATLVALKGILLEVSMRNHKSSIAGFNSYTDLLKRELREAPEQCKAFEATMIYHGRA